MLRPRHRVSLSFEGETTKTQQHLKKFADINCLISRCLTGDSSVFRPTFHADLTEVPDSMQEFLNLQVKAREAYEGLPDAVRRRFPSPETFLRACCDPDSCKELAKLGLVKPEEKQSAVKVEVVNPQKSEDQGA